MARETLNDSGFTLIELMVVIVILGILATLIVPRFMGREEEARRTMARAFSNVSTPPKLCHKPSEIAGSLRPLWPHRL